MAENYNEQKPRPKPPKGIKAIHKKKSLVERTVLQVLGPKDTGGIGSNIRDEIIIPMIKDAIVKSVVSGIQMLVNGKVDHSSSSYIDRKYDTRHVPRRDYGSYSRQPDSSRNYRSGIQIESFEFETREEALDVLNYMEDLCRDYQVCRVSDYYAIMNYPTRNVDMEWGWQDLGGATVKLKMSGKWYIALPSAYSIRD